MNTFLQFLGFLFLIYLIKFVYDTFITNNTEKDWQKYKRQNPDDARIIETNKGLDFSTIPKLLTTGLYRLDYSGKKDGHSFNITQLLIFGKGNKVFRYEFNGVLQLTTEKIKLISAAAIAIFNNELDKNVTIYTLEGNHIDMKFYNDPSRTDLFFRFEGTVIKNGLILDVSNTYIDFELMKINTEIYALETQFIFIPAV